MRHFLLAGLLALALPAAAQSAASPAQPDSLTRPIPADSVRYWDTHLNAHLNANEALLSSNWKGGGTSTLGLSLLAQGQAHYQRKRHNWNGEADFLYAGQYTADDETGYRKTSDRLYLDAKYGRALSKNWGLFTALNLLSQFAPGYDYADDNSATLISSFLAPGYLTSSTGAEYRPNERFNLRLAPLAPRVTLVRRPDRLRHPADTTIYGVAPGHVAYWEFGFQALTQLNQPLGEHANLDLRYVFFFDYGHPTLRESSHRMDLTFTASLNEWLNVTLGGIVLYDYRQDKRFQYNQNLSLGLLFDRKRPARRP